MKKLKRFYRVMVVTVIFTVMSSSLAFSEIKIEGLDKNESLKDYINEKVIEPYNNQEIKPRPAATKAKILKALKAKSYYYARVRYELSDIVTFSVQPEQAYQISSYDILGYSTPVNLNIIEGDALIAKDVLREQAQLLRQISEENCFYKLSVKHRIYLDHITHSGDISFDVKASDNAVFGETTFIGADKIDREYLDKFLKYEKGNCWKALKLEDTKTALMQTGLISSLNTSLPEKLPPNGHVPIQIELKERAPRSVRLGADFSTSEGPGILAEWAHRNFYGSAEKLSVSTRISSITKNIGLDFSKPFFLSDKQNFNFTSSLEREDTDAFEEFSINALASINRELSKNWSGSLGAGFNLLQVREEGEQTDNFALVSFPGTLNYDSRDDVLNPQKGHTLNILAEPFIDVIGTAPPFFKTRITGTTYVDMWNKTILALRTSIGSIYGSETADIPASERFYAGGGGSIRGFGFQEAGPVDADNDPAGGRSLIETSAEMRFKITDKIGGVTFVDAGGVYDSPFPNLEGGAFVGAGIGLRYYTDFGPIRFDIAVPVNKKDNIDQNYQFYISIGQAF